jgi:hypothetical protein
MPVLISSQIVHITTVSAFKEDLPCFNSAEKKCHMPYKYDHE